MAQEEERHIVSVEVSLSKTEPQIAPDEQVCALHGFLLHQCVSECSIPRRKVLYWCSPFTIMVWVENEEGMYYVAMNWG